MPETIRRASFIAQPPLTSEARKKEQFRRTTASRRLASTLHRADGANTAGSVALMGAPLRNLLSELLHWRNQLARLDRRADSRIIQALVRHTTLDAEGLKDDARVAKAVEEIKAGMLRSHQDVQLQVTVARDEEHGCAKITVCTRWRLGTYDCARFLVARQAT